MDTLRKTAFAAPKNYYGPYYLGETGKKVCLDNIYAVVNAKAPFSVMQCVTASHIVIISHISVLCFDGGRKTLYYKYEDITPTRTSSQQHVDSV